MRNVHLIGIGGVGMNGAAQLAAGKGYVVSGSDRAYDTDAPLFQSMERTGIRIHPQNGSGIDARIDQIVYSTAIEDDNADLIAARKRGLPLLHRAEFLKQLIGDAELIAVAGTAGKSTVTGMLGWIFECLGFNPSVYNGAAVLNWKTSTVPGNVRQGSPDLWIIEADESDRSFLSFHPSHAIVTNIFRDHFELEELNTLFGQFRKQTSGIVVNGDDLPLESGGPNRLLYNDMEFFVPLPGRHNLDNALCAIRLCDALDMDMERVRDAMAGFKGIERRLQVMGTADGVTIIDDYAHNPAKIAAALAAVSESGSRIHAFWRPHGFTPLFQSLTDLVHAFSRHWKEHGGSVFILPVFYAGGSVERKVTSADLVEHLVSAGVPAQCVRNYNVLKQRLEHTACSGDTILGMGARDPELPRFAERLLSEWKKN